MTENNIQLGEKIVGDIQLEYLQMLLYQRFVC